MTTPDPTNPDDTDALLADWAAELREALRVDPDVDIRGILGVAGTAAHAVVRPAAPLTTYLIGFVAGRAAAQGEDPAVAAAAALRIVKDRAADRP